MRWLVLVLLCSCTGNIANTGTPPGPGPDAATADSRGSDHPDGAVTLDAPAFACRNTVTTVGSGKHHPGEDCQGACHNHGFTLGVRLSLEPVVDHSNSDGSGIEAVSVGPGENGPEKRFEFASLLGLPRLPCFDHRPVLLSAH